MDNLKILIFILVCNSIVNAQKTPNILDIKQKYQIINNGESIFSIIEAKDSYLPILNSEQSWISVASSGFEPPSSFQHTFSEDSILIKTQYYFERIVSKNNDGSDPYVLGYYREFNGMIYEMLDTNFNERIVMDMSLNQGDSINIDQVFISTNLVAVKVDTVIYDDGAIRKRIELKCAQNPDDYGSRYWVEGIGELSSGIYCALDGGDSYLTCVLNEDGDRIYTSIDDNENCWLFTNVDELQQKSVFIFPNPSNNIINISGLYSQISVGYIYNNYGQIITNFDNESIDISTFTPGVYFVKLIDNENRVFNSKFIKTN